ncbi:hypothetical protein [Texcoconibacillus texcoconensis]|uniref:Uncharacterized protein n=1 Tax=Texcoconibacillus texcoconensis TaxID=1095777 RepID=A0A840QRC5_9BACI|nr:hypothetical protein [Texcoconibacillus texcoconensis]MBB5174016.1 hypothetical protein [Texcoconibacillus texcoconensis]
MNVIKSILAITTFTTLLGCTPNDTNDLDNGDTEEELQQEDEDINEETTDSDSATDTKVDRPQTKEITTYPEGMEQEDTYQLLNKADLPFTTYIREDWIKEQSESDIIRGVQLGPDGFEYISMDIVFFKEGVSDEEAMAYYEEIHTAYNNSEEAETDDLPDWALERYKLSEEPYGSVTLGEYEDYFFYIVSEYDTEAADGFAHLEAVILDEWEWKETGEPLDDESRLDKLKP